MPPDEPRPIDLVLTRDAARALDRACAEEFGLPTIALMENASARASEIALSMLDPAGDDPNDPDSVSGRRVLIVVGPGSNGGDGLGVARHLANHGVRVAILLACEPSSISGDAGVMLGVARAMGLPLRAWDASDPGASLAAAIEPLGGEADLVIDALFGSGLNRALDGPMARLVGDLNTLIAAGADALALDTPSGLDVDTGRPRGAAIQADVTVTFVASKAGFLAIEAQPYLGEVVVADIGAPRVLLERLGVPVSPPMATEEGAETTVFDEQTLTPGRTPGAD